MPSAINQAFTISGVTSSLSLPTGPYVALRADSATLTVSTGNSLAGSFLFQDQAGTVALEATSAPGTYTITPGLWPFRGAPAHYVVRPDPSAAELEAELQAHQARLRQVMQAKLPPTMWRAYVEACIALADGLGVSARRALRQTLSDLEPSDDPPPDRPLGFRP